MARVSPPAVPAEGFPLYCAPGFEPAAAVVAAARGLSWCGGAPAAEGLPPALVLWLDHQGLSLCHTTPKSPGPIRCDFVGGEARHRRLYGGGKSQAIARAVGIKGGVRPVVADLTAGLGADGFVLASLGCRVTLVERHPVIAALLSDGLARARACGGDPELAPIVARMALHCMPASQWLVELAEAEKPQVIYLDPMFPERGKSAQVNKAMQAFQQLVGGDPDADDLLFLALAAASHRVVVKRPARAPWLGNEKPSHSLEGKAVRFDVYGLRRLTSDG